ncbi:MAG: class I SAM-dependent methyltransferase [Cyclobacteriaceae bacterium]|nr:class I SAM-dependent methyltransferase [Cyclobacteriaceae bacterium]
MKKGREPLSFDTSYFSKMGEAARQMPAAEKFRFIYENNLWKGEASLSGQGSDGIQTQVLQKELPGVLKKYSVQSLLDLPCGDFQWMRNIDLEQVQYIGADIIEDLILKNRESFQNRQRQFLKLDLLQDPLPKADLVFCRDCWVHFSFEDIFKSIKNIQASGISYLFTTTFTECRSNDDIVTGDWRILNLQLAPFHFPPPLLLLNEQCTEAGGTYADKSMGLWKLPVL